MNQEDKNKGWEATFDQKFGGLGYAHPNGTTTYTLIHERRKDFIRTLLASEKEKNYEIGYKDGESSKVADIICLLEENERIAVDVIGKEAKEAYKKELIEKVEGNFSQNLISKREVIALLRK